MTVVEFLRHAKARSRKEWREGPERERPLADQGWQQAKLLAEDLPAHGAIDAIYASPLVRCVQSVEPLAGALGLEIVTTERLAELRTLPVTDGGRAWVASAWLGGRAVGFLDEVVARYEGGRVVVCSHGDVVGATLALLAGHAALRIPDVHTKKGARATLRFDAGRCVGISLEAPPSPPV